jgi:hypothetical protein
MAARARRRGAGHVRPFAVLGDVAPRMWNLAAARFPEATRVDLQHAREHRHDLGKLLAFMPGHGDAASNPAPAGSRSGGNRTTRHNQLTSQVRQVDLATCKFVAPYRQGRACANFL